MSSTVGSGPGVTVSTDGSPTEGSESTPIQGDSSSLSRMAAVGAILGCVIRTVSLLLHGRIHSPRKNIGEHIRFADGTSAPVYRETRIDIRPLRKPAVLVVAFQLRLIRTARGHALFRPESVLNTVLFAGFPGLVSKLWLRHDENGVYRGLYEWDGSELALTYAQSLWWVLALVSVPGSIRFVIVPGVGTDAVLGDPTVLDYVPGASGDWWRPVGVSDHAVRGHSHRSVGSEPEGLHGGN